MPTFKLTLRNNEGMRFVHYDTDTSEVRDDNGRLLDISFPEGSWDSGPPKYPAPRTDYVSCDHPVTKQRFAARSVKVQLGMACNYRCGYCRQEDCDSLHSGTPSDVTPLVDSFKSWLPTDDRGVRFDIRGGEPFVYWKTLKPFVEQARTVYPKCRIHISTNGSLLDREKADWLIRHHVHTSISHDGPGQWLRGDDPLDNPTARDAICIYSILGRGRVSR